LRVEDFRDGRRVTGGERRRHTSWRSRRGFFSFEAYEEHRHERLGAEADRPGIRYKKLVRA
jgi:hypothetical protein